MGTKITQLPQVATPTGSDELPISQDTGSGRTTYKTTLDQVKNYVKNTGGGTGTVTSVGVNSNDGSIGVIGSPVVGAGTISLSISSVGLNKLDDGGAIGGQVLTYDGSTSTWVASAVPSNFIGKPASATGGQVLTYNGSTSTWVASSLSANGFQASLSSNGYQKLPSGLIMQWGKTTTPLAIGSSTPISFPIPFPNNCLSLTLTIDGTPSPDNAVYAPQYSSTSTTGFTAVNKDVDSEYNISYQAIGY